MFGGRTLQGAQAKACGYHFFEIPKHEHMEKRHERIGFR